MNWKKIDTIFVVATPDRFGRANAAPETIVSPVPISASYLLASNNPQTPARGISFMGEC